MLLGDRKGQRVRIGFMGDVMLGRLVNEVLKDEDPKYPWGNVLPILQKNDINIINLETTMTISEDLVPKVFNFKSDPKNVQVLKEGNVDIVNLANNHIFDFGVRGLLETISVLDNAGIKHVGAGKDIKAAQKAVIIEKNGIKIGVIGFTDNEPSWKATDDKPGTNYVHIGDIALIKEAIKPVREIVDILIITIHWGPNMRQAPTETYRDFAHEIIDAGVDIIHGQSAHIFQGIERYKNKLILYDTGDFIDDYAIDPVLRNDQSFLFLVDVDKNNIIDIQLVPVVISNFQVNKADSQKGKAMIEKINLLSRDLLEKK
ncbi:hypothetical protein A3F06_03055 [candidate division TM6 bacterium RIFCSPHIGHO2_12_FULL_36_22]|nr:MAG: hypothetical protein A3F06_03055 [candidate division TM6 bacterium RIFCSPHIGHO2_12_FULL_36_22]